MLEILPQTNTRKRMKPAKGKFDVGISDWGKPDDFILVTSCNLFYLMPVTSCNLIYFMPVTSRSWSYKK